MNLYTLNLIPYETDNFYFIVTQDEKCLLKVILMSNNDVDISQLINQKLISIKKLRDVITLDDLEDKDSSKQKFYIFNI